MPINPAGVTSEVALSQMKLHDNRLLWQRPRRSPRYLRGTFFRLRL
jgi:hypothetical protein